MKICYLCKEQTKRPVLSFLYHFALIDFENIKFAKGTYKTFGLKSTLTLISPFFNTMLNFKHFNKKLKIGE